MNWKGLILLLCVLQHVYQLALGWVQYRSANNPTPENVQDVYDQDTYVRWKKYSGEKSRLGLMGTCASLIVTLLLLVLNVHARVAGLFQGMFLQVVSVFVFQTLVDTVVQALFNYVETMKIEEKYGFNKSTMKTFILDQVRSFVIELLLNGALIGLAALLHRTMGNWMVLLFAVAAFLLTLCISFLYPILSRVGNKFVPLEEGELKDKLMALLMKHGYQVKAIEVMDASRRTTKLNAYFTGFGKMKTIVLYDNLVNAMSTEEICAVFAHELGHGLHKDVLKQQTMNFGNLLLMAVTVWAVVSMPALHTAFGFEQMNYGFAYILLGVALGCIQPLTGMAMNAYSRFAEYRADRQAAEEGYGAALCTGLKTLAKENFAHLAPSKALVVLEYSHPPLSERIAALEKAMQ